MSLYHFESLCVVKTCTESVKKQKNNNNDNEKISEYFCCI